MKQQKQLLSGGFAAMGMALLILDNKTALAGAREGLELCIRTVIPSLFPFFVLSALLTASLMGKRIRFLAPICRFCRIPPGAESLLAAGFLGGYPVGAQCIAQTCQAGGLSHADARRMLAFCNNCGPSFLFGMVPGLFDQWWAAWALWGIHIVSALCTARLIPGSTAQYRSTLSGKPLSVVAALQQAIRVMAGVCGLVVLFRVILSVLQRWLLGWLTPVLQVSVSGLLELSNGCLMLDQIENTGLRFIICGMFLSFGGVCVAMQTFSVTEGIDRSDYFPGKVVQCCISFLLAYGLQAVVFPPQQRAVIPLWIPALFSGICVIFAFMLRKKKNSSGIIQLVGV